MDYTILKLLVVISIGRLTSAQCNDPIDIVIVADGSQSIGPFAFETLKKNLASFGSQLAVSDTGVKVGLVLYSSKIETGDVIPLTGNADILSSTISGLLFPEGGTNTHLGIYRAIQMFSVYGRLGVPRIMVVITDGYPDDRNQTKTSADTAKNSGITIYAVGVGAGVDGAALKAIASKGNTVKQASNFTVLIDTLTNLTQTICETQKPVVATTIRTSETQNSVVATTIRTPVDTGLCSDCDFVDGVDYKSYPGSCRKYVQCQVIRGVLTPTVQNCGDRLFWNQELMNCKEFYDSDCNKGECSDGNSYIYQSISNCGLYFNCTDSIITMHCCDSATPQFDESSKTCVAASSCTQECSLDKPDQRQLVQCHNATHKPHFDENGQQDLCQYGVGEMYVMKCPAGTIYSNKTCMCTTLSKLCDKPSGRALGDCEDDFYMPFTKDLLKDVKSRAWVGSKGVPVLNEQAIFDGQDKHRLYINRYSNNDFDLPLVISVVFKDTNGQPNMAVLSNGGCINRPSIYITAGNGIVTIGAVTVRGGYDSPIESTISTSSTNSWKQVKMLFDGTKLIGEATDLDDTFQSISSPEAFEAQIVPGESDKVLKVHGGFQLGYAHENKYPGFIGTVSELRVWKGCKNQLTLDQYP